MFWNIVILKPLQSSIVSETRLARARVGPQDKQGRAPGGPPALLTVAPMTRRFNLPRFRAYLTSPGLRYSPPPPIVQKLRETTSIIS